MSKLYNKAFKVGVWFSISLFVISNVISFFISRNEYMNKEIHFADADGYSWGFPFEMYRFSIGYPYSEDGFTLDGTIINTIVLTTCSFILGFSFRFISSKIAARRSPLK